MLAIQSIPTNVMPALGTGELVELVSFDDVQRLANRVQRQAAARICEMAFSACGTPGCSGLVDSRTADSRGYCDRCRLPVKKSRVSIDRKKFYRSGEWKRVSQLVRERDEFTCQLCGKFGKIVDHIRSLAERWDLRLTESNLQTLCESCHGKKTRKEMNERKW